jgi:hypothetical protein
MRHANATTALKSASDADLGAFKNGECILRYDNEAGKGDHRHRAGRETSYVFTSVVALVKDFFNDVARWRNENHG